MEKNNFNQFPNDKDITNTKNINKGEFNANISNTYPVINKKKSLFKLLVSLGLIISLGLNGFLLYKTSVNNPNLVTTNKTVNYNVKSSTTDVIKKVQDSVVGIITYKASSTAPGGGSGVIYKTEGNTAYIITNAHVINGASKISVMFTNKKIVDAQVVGSDVFSDVAVLKLSPNFKVLPIKTGDSELVDVGETVLAIGSPLGIEYAGTVTQGIVSATNRTISVDLNKDGKSDWSMTTIQTDAAINPGNSGGAFVNMAGELVGITSMKYSSTEVEGMGFALPINDVLKVVKQLETKGKADRPKLGIRAYALSDYNSLAGQYGNESGIQDGIYISEVVDGSAAKEAGLKVGDIIIKFDGLEMKDYKTFLQALYSKKTGDVIKLSIVRGSQTIEVSVKLQ